MLAASCSNDEVVNVAPQSGAIGFSSFVNNSTRATDADAFGSGKEPGNMKVYALTKYSDNSVRSVFDTEDFVTVTKEGEKWTYSPLRYWIAGNTYTFAAIAPADAEGVTVNLPKEEEDKVMKYGGISSISFSNNGETDLLYDEEELTEGVAASRGAVAYTLGHLLSRVRFKFENGINEKYSLKIKDVKISDATKAATYDPASKEWTVADGNVDQEFQFTISSDAFTNEGKAVSDNKYVISAKKAHTATFSLQLIETATGIPVGGADNWITHKDVTLPEIDFTPGWSYTYSATITSDNINTDPDHPTLNPIEFKVTKVDNFNENTAEGKYLEPKPNTEGGNENQQ